MMFNYRLAVLTICVVAWSAPASATRPTPVFTPGPVFIPPGVTDCKASDHGAPLSGWATFDKRLPVRDAPSESAKIIAYLPPFVAEGDDSTPTRFDILETRPGWLKISRAEDESSGYKDGGEKLYNGDGWVPATAATVAVQSGHGYAKPDTSSTRLIDLGNDNWLTDQGARVTIRACSGDWLLLDYTFTDDNAYGSAFTGKHGTAWFRGICTLLETTCDMDSVDDKP